MTNGTSVRLGGEGRVAAVVGGRSQFRLLPGEAVRVTPEGRGIRVAGDAGAGRYERLTFVSLDRSRFVTVEGKPYRGVVDVFVGGGALTVVNEVPVEAYLAGVVNAELGRRTANERAAVEAQAIVARTFALKNIGRRSADGFDLRATPADQAYGGVAAETELGRQAVRATAGKVVTYRGELIETFFHSTCGYSTASPEEVFRWGRRLPYLRPVSDRRPNGHYCDISPRFRWTVEWEAETLQRILRRTVPAVLGIEGAKIDVLRDVRVHRTGPSGRVIEARIGVSQGEVPVFGPDLRSVLRTPDGRLLGSTAVQFAVDKRDGRVQRVQVSGAGWGHGVGMCQWGAVGRARAGQDARTIVTTYFPGTRIERRY
ncbi:MAG: SpoIID/LytB domain-containing protein [Gemmatimonadales bacterium]|nr:SpoIID/LytB domain-containing protein [Gemmatimonadales bacterium]NIN12307.1 SpoIID/LytB domain-containing protein [Gemmatimonadales bacterium]NIN48845.1 SpoIID/LytB domain-containing protein [Gemmatimonadales bacterium]NIP06309.1 SpoIID/LytB domain-containing protein [Gemmatimonadales bacterium]NIR00681.1 SpoIID/LytB domain-containing protein [Gemmatimonadales bacterium]